MRSTSGSALACASCGASEWTVSEETKVVCGGCGAEATYPDGDELTNNEERVWGLDPTSSHSSHPIVDPINAGGVFSYTRRDPALTGLTYSVWTSTDMENWNEDTSAIQNAGAVDANGAQTVEVTLTPTLLSADELFFQVRAE